MAQQAVPNFPYHECLRQIGQGAFGTVYLCKRRSNNAPAIKGPTPPPEGGGAVGVPVGAVTATAGGSIGSSAEQANNQQEPEFVAIKVIKNYNRDDHVAKRVWLEIAILHCGQAIPQVVPMYSLYQVCTERTDTTSSSQQQTHTLKDLHLIMDYVPNDLAKLIGSKAIDTEEKIRTIISQLFLGIRGLQKMQVLHRDLSSRNILVTNNLLAYICDFGLARLYDPDEQMSYGVITQWYRAPEVLLDCKYGYPVDVWAIGVMMAELFLQKHLFPGRNKDIVHQLLNILDVLGGVPLEALNDPEGLGTCSANARAYMERQTSRRGTGLHSIRFAVEPSPLARNLLHNLLVMNPKERFTADQALMDPWFHSDTQIRRCIVQEIEFQDSQPPAVPSTTGGESDQQMTREETTTSSSEGGFPAMSFGPSSPDDNHNVLDEAPQRVVGSEDTNQTNAAATGVFLRPELIDFPYCLRFEDKIEELLKLYDQPPTPLTTPTTQQSPSTI